MRRIGAVLRAGVLWALVFGLLAGAAGAWFGAKRDELHRATSVVLVNPLEGNPFNPDSREGLLNLETEARLVTSDAVARAVSQELTAPPGDVLAGVSVEVPPNTQLLRITAEGKDPDRVEQLATLVAKSYLSYRASRTAATVFDRKAHLIEEVRTMKSELAGLVTKRNAAGTSASSRALLDQQVTGLVAQIAQVQTEQTALGYVSQDPGQVVTPAAADGAGLLPGTVLGGLAGVGLGIAIAVALLVARGRRTGLVGSRLDVTAAGHDVLASADEPDVARARLLVAHPDRPLVLLVADVARATDVAPGTADRVADLVSSFARARFETIQVDLSDGVTEPDDDDAPLGMYDVISQHLPPEKGLHRTGDFLRVMTRGAGRKEAARAADLLASPAFETLLADLRQLADVVMISGVTLPGSADQVVVGLADAVVLWVTPGGTTHDTLQAAEHLVDCSAATLAGVVHDATVHHRRRSWRR